jgi:L-lactate dehydrogenase
MWACAMKRRRFPETKTHTAFLLAKPTPHNVNHEKGGTSRSARRQQLNGVVALSAELQGDNGEEMKLGIVGTGQVGCAIAIAAVTRGSAREIVLVNRTRKTAEAVATDIRYGAPLCDRVEIADADYDGLEGAGVVLITSGVNEKTGGAINRNDPEGRLKLLDQNAVIYREIVPKIARTAPTAVLVAVTDPPDPLADIARETAGHDRVLSTGTFLDSLRFRVHVGRHFGVSPADVEAQVIGDHGTSQVFLWSSARVGGVPVASLLNERGEKLEDLRKKVENDVRYANITIIEGHDASQYGIGIVSARIAEMVLRDERAAIPIGSYQREFGVTLSLPSVIGSCGVVTVMQPVLSTEESSAFERSAESLRRALARLRNSHQ